MRAVFGARRGAASATGSARPPAARAGLRASRRRSMLRSRLRGRTGLVGHGAVRADGRRRSTRPLLGHDRPPARCRGPRRRREDILSLLLLARDEDGEPLTDRESRRAADAARRRPRDHRDRARLGARAPRPHARGARAAARPSVRPGSDEYLEAVVKETLRLRPVVPLVVAPAAGADELRRRATCPPGVDDRARRSTSSHRRPGPLPRAAARSAPSASSASAPGTYDVDPVRRRRAPLPRRGVRRSSRPASSSSASPSASSLPRAGAARADRPPRHRAHPAPGRARGARAPAAARAGPPGHGARDGRRVAGLSASAGALHDQDHALGGSEPVPRDLLVLR